MLMVIMSILVMALKVMVMVLGTANRASHHAVANQPLV